MVSSRTNTIVGGRRRRASAACPTARRVARRPTRSLSARTVDASAIASGQNSSTPRIQNPPAQKHVGVHGHVDSPYQACTRDRADVGRLRRLYAAISECLEGANTDGAVTR